MEYQLSAELTAPENGPDLDPLQQVGVVALLDSRLSRLAGIEGPDGVEITPVEHAVHAHLGGANVSWLLDAPALVFAEDATRAVLEQLLEETELLRGWQVKHCAVTATDDQLESALAASTEPADDGVIEIDPADQLELTERRQRLLDASEYLRAFELDAFGFTDGGDVTEQEARYVAGAVMHGVEMVTDELFGDIQLLEDEDGTAVDVEALWVMDELPQQYADQYTALFAKQLLVTTAILGYRLTQEEWTAPLCLAEALALHVVKSRAELELDLADAMPEERAAEIFAHFDDYAFADGAHEELYDVSDLEAFDSDVITWFRPDPRYNDTAGLHPYLTDED
ncbi:hypothetical protein [Prauserella alba]|uniref:DUF4272 domain-containing protein n=1 Tax=Prauserella alba TaxID=176898 RepID=A0ABP4GFA0_9PSEU|nr:hypothetical protein [Prauserella alba]MCP2183807.1 hypothetical protein [Prauserella alba]